MHPPTVPGWSRVLPQAGSGRLRDGLRDSRDRLIASDPGLGRLRQGLKAVLAVGTTVLVELVYARAVGGPVTLAVLLGAIVAMLVSTLVSEPSRTKTLGMMAGVPVAATVGAVLGVVTSAQHVLGLVTFVLVSFAAVWVRRFGPRWFTYGFLAWQGFFFALFLHPPPAALPFLIGAIAVASLWVGLLLLTVLRGNPQVRLGRTVDALRARSRAAIAAMLDVLEDPDANGPPRRLRAQLVQLSEIALLMDGQLADPRAVPSGLRRGQVRRWTVDIEIAMDEAAAAVVELAQHQAGLAAPVRSDVRQLLRSLGWGTGEQAHRWVRALEQETSHAPGVRRLVWAATDLLRLVEQWDSGQLDDPRASRADAQDPLDATDADGQFEPVITLFAGNLPGSAAVASSVVEDESARAWWSPARLKLTTRQAFQAALAAALAILVGEAISPQRYYWAVITAFIAFTGASNTGETVQRGVARVAGTMAGLLGAIALAHLTTGHHVAALAALFASIFLAFYLQQLSYAAMIFFITLLLGQMYTLLNTFTDAVLVLRLEETAAGAVIGVLVSIFVLPTGTRATARAARSGFLGQLADLMDGCADHLRLDRNADLIALTVGLDAWSRQIVNTYRAVARGGLMGVDRVRLRHRLSLLGACGAHARALAALVTESDVASAELADACTQLAAQARRLADLDAVPPRSELEVAVAERERITSSVAALADADPSSRAASIEVGRVADVLALLAAP
ncbi:FUSC family protein [Terrabacter aerolatus]|uniref:Membrane protein n=1 Tax=Terrabacter aerolatus TaxID=422442 RepID=A0A512CYZ4_9MICO|nr:FUSC family protein [Terrabacter aerolatus]GEO29429.1 membrane protein [Terrabacter aerolatus]